MDLDLTRTRRPSAPRPAPGCAPMCPPRRCPPWRPRRASPRTARGRRELRRGPLVGGRPGPSGTAAGARTSSAGWSSRRSTTRRARPAGSRQNGISLLAPTLFDHGTEEQRARVLPSMASGEVIWAQAWSEPEAGSDLASLRSRAVRTDGGWLLSGQKTWSSRAAFADRAFGLFRTRPGRRPKPHQGLTYLMFDLRAPGVTVRPIGRLDGKPAFAELFLDEVFVPDEDVIGEPGQGWRIAMSTAGNERGLTLRSPGRFLAARGPAGARCGARQGEPGDTALRDRVADALIGARAYQLFTYAAASRFAGGRVDRRRVQPEQGLLVGVRHRAARDGARSAGRGRASWRTDGRGPRGTSSRSPARSTPARTRSSATSSPSGCSACRRAAADALPADRRAAGVRPLAGRDADGRGHTRRSVRAWGAGDHGRRARAVVPSRRGGRLRAGRSGGVRGAGAAPRRTGRRLRGAGAARGAGPAGGDGRGGGAARRRWATRASAEAAAAGAGRGGRGRGHAWRSPGRSPYALDADAATPSRSPVAGDELRARPRPRPGAALPRPGPAARPPRRPAGELLAPGPVWPPPPRAPSTWARLATAAQALGVGLALLDRTVAYVGQRTQFGVAHRLVPGGQAPAGGHPDRPGVRAAAGARRRADHGTRPTSPRRRWRRARRRTPPPAPRSSCTARSATPTESTCRCG